MKHDSDPLPRGIVFTSYPRSGSNWVRTLLAQALDESGDPNIMIKSAGKPGPVGTLPFRGEEVPVLKTHFRVQRFGELFEDVVAVLTIHRHPLDVLLSSLNFLHERKRDAYFKNGVRKPLNEIVASGEIDEYIDRFAADDGVSAFSGTCGPFSDYHYDMRAYAEDHTVFDMKYEDLHADKAAGLASVLDFLEVKSGLSANEIVFSAENKEWRQPSSVGKSAYTFLKLLNPASIERFYRLYGKQAAKLGYPENDVPDLGLNAQVKAAAATRRKSRSRVASVS